jgi:hypothetical protein
MRGRGVGLDTSGTRVDAVNPTEEVGPGEAAASVWLTGRIRRRIGDHAGLGVWCGRRLRGGRGVGSTPTTCERGAAAGVGGEDTMVSHHVDPRWRDESGEPAKELRWREHDLPGTVGEGAFHAIADATVIGEAETFDGDRGAQTVATDTFEADHRPFDGVLRRGGRVGAERERR